jgi:predicted peptidase
MTGSRANRSAPCAAPGSTAAAAAGSHAGLRVLGRMAAVVVAFAVSGCAMTATHGTADPGAEGAAGTNRSAADAPVAGTQVARSAELQVTRDHSGRYLLHLPREYDASRRWPLLLFLHGAGERGDDLSRVAIHGPPRLIREAAMELPFIVVSPQVSEDRIWSVAFLDALLDEIAASYSVDEDRVYVTGLSMGGYGTWHLAMEFPDRFAAIAPISGGATITGACTLRHVPVWVFHGALDEVVPPSRSEELVQRLRNCDGHVRFTLYEDAGHDAWTRTYADPELYRWLLTHRRRAPGPRDEATH